ncbi:MAG: hypothetical protein Q7J54_05765 [Candidatus Woesearchaeota archaeon]|nr:hypothetical protein [Candidatus Woesearchaeota archaeon]
MKKSHYLFLISIIVLVFLISACGKKDTAEKCKSDSDCAAKTCYDSSCVKGKCSYIAEMNCCGNKIKEAGETECSCPADYGQCAAKTKEGITYACNEKDECVPTTTAQTFSSEKDVGKFKLQLSTTLDKPFDTRRSILGLGIMLVQLDAGVTDVKINKVMVESSISSSTVLLGEKSLERTLWKISDVISDDIMIDYDFGADKADKQISLRIFYEYKDKGISSSGSYAEQIKTPVTFVRGPETLCPDSCDDGNRCTNDYCNEQTNNFCRHDMLSDCNGNWICETGETKCNAPTDCGPCEGDVGSYMQYGCFEDECQVAVKEGSQLSKTYPNTKTASYFTLDFDVFLKQPLNIKNNTVKIDFTLNKFDEKNAVLPLMIKKVQINDKTVVLGQKTDVLVFSTVGQTDSIEIPVSSYEFEGYQKDIYFNIKIDYEFGKTSYGAITAYADSFEQALKEKVTLIKSDVN